MKTTPLLQIGISLILALAFSHATSMAGDILMVDAGPDQILQLPTNTTTVTAIATGGKFETSDWSVVGGTAANVTIDSPTTLSTGLSFSAPGVYTLEIAVSPGSTPVTDTLVITVLPAAAMTYRPDVRIGTKAPPNSHKGNDIYNGKGNGQRLVLKTQNRRPITFYFSIENDGTVEDRIGVRGAGVSRSRFKVAYLDTSEGKPKNVSGQILAGRYVKSYAPAEIRKFKATIVRRPNSAKRRLIRVNPRFKASSKSAPRNLPDVADAKLFFL